MERLTSVNSPRSGIAVHLGGLALLACGPQVMSFLLTGIGSVVTYPITRELRFTANRFEIFNAELLLIYLVAVLGLSLITNAGLISLGHGALFGVGAYSVALSTDRGWDFIPALIAAAVISGLLAVPLGFPAMRLGHFTLAIVTFGYALVFMDLIDGFRGFTNGEDGISGIPRPAGAEGLTSYYWWVAGFVVLAYAACHNSLRSPIGRRSRAVALNETATTSLGVEVRETKLVLFVASAVMTGVAGALYAGLVGYVTPSAFTADLAILFLLMILLGGPDTLAGPIIGTVLLFRVPLEVQRVSPDAGEWTLLIYGIVLLCSVYLFPKGIMSWWFSLRQRMNRGRTRAEGVTDTVLVDLAAAVVRVESTKGESALVATDVSVALGGVRALGGVSLVAEYGQVLGLIGPNGSGKTTFLNTVCGYVRPDTGNVCVLGEDMTAWKPATRASRGLARTFQTSLLFDELSCLENVMVAVDCRHAGRGLSYVVRLPDARRREREAYAAAASILSAFGLAGRVNDAAGDLPPGERRLLELARVVALGPKLVLMDEPAAGLNEAECGRLADIIGVLRERGLAVILVEHDVNLIREVCDSVTVLDAGVPIASGTPDEVLRNPRVISSYLGEMGLEQSQQSGKRELGDVQSGPTA